jgi:hypothetical protein
LWLCAPALACCSLEPPRCPWPPRCWPPFCPPPLCWLAPRASPDLGHVLPVLAHDLTALAARLARLLGVELVRRALLVRGPAALARDLALLGFIHRRETSIAAPLTALILRHDQAPFVPTVWLRVAGHRGSGALPATVISETPRCPQALQWGCQHENRVLQ